LNFPRVVLAALASWGAYVAVGFLVDILLSDLYAEHASLMRPAADRGALVPWGLGVSLLGFFAFAYAYAKGYEGGTGAQEGLRYGVLVGLMLVAFASIREFMTYPVSMGLLGARVIDFIVEFAVYGAIVGTIYRPAHSGTRRPVSA
jgi:hypothetical protein